MLDTAQTGVNLYVTFVEKEGPFLKIWGQTDKNNSVYVEQFLMGAGPQFDMGVAKVSPEHVQLNTLVCAKYKDSKYYRARVLNNSFLREGFVEVCFLDYGNKDVVPIDNVRSLQSFPTSFISIPPLATGFIFAEARCVGGGEWNDTIFESIVKEIKYREVHCQLLSPATQYYLIKIIIDGADLCNVLIQRGLMQPISLQAQQGVLLSMSMQRQTQSASAPAMTSPPNSISSGGLNTYKASSLEPSCLYPVYVSYVNDGPCHFSVQLKNSEEVLVKLMNEVNSINLRLLEDIPIPGTICLARCQEDGNICRAVVTNEVDNQFKVFYVDFGNYEVVPLDSLYQIPFKYVLPKVMAIRVCLTGVEKSTVTLEMQRAFKQFVDNRLLHMKVIPTPQRMAIPKCELWDPETKTSALDVVNRAARHAYPEPISLTRGFSQLVKVSYVYSCNRFYVQLSSKETELTTLMADLQEICQSNDPMDPASLKTGLPCCALYETDGQWYRSEIVEVLGDNVIVRYIDYGNEEPVPITQLKNIDGEQLTVLRPQAIECCLNGYQNMDDDQERDQLLDELILESEFTMKVVEMLNKKALVELFDANNCNVASLLLDRLAMAKSQVSPALVVQAGNKIEHKKSFSQQNGPFKGRDGQVFKFDREDRGDRQDRGDRPFRDDRRDRGDRGDRQFRDDRRDRGDRQGRERRDFNKAPNENWRQDGNKEFRKYDKNSNESGPDSWRQNNKGFSPKHQNRYNKPTENDAWESNTTSSNNNDNWNKNSSSKQNNGDDWGGNTNNANSGSGDAWNNTPTSTAPSNNDEWNTPANDRGYNNFGGRANGGGRFNNDRGGRGGGRGDNFRGKSRDRDGGFRNKSDSRSENSYDGSEKSYHQKGPRTSSRNDRFQKHFDKPRNNNSFQASNDDSWNVSAVTSPIDAAPVTATYGSCRVVGTEAKVTISWFHNPSHFYLQLVNSQNEFKLLMEDIQQFYKSRKPELVSAVGAPVIGLFPEDNVLYRAQILEILGSQYKIYYVDFGNVSTVTKIWPIEKKFMNLPAQAIVCSLRDVAPPGEIGKWPDADSYGSYFDKDSFICRFIDEDENKTYVNLFYNSEDISETLVQNGLAVSTKSSIPPVEIPLLLGQQFRAIVKSVNNLADIILALECGSVVCCAMHNLETATETYEDTLKAILEQTVIVYVDNVIDDKLEITLYDTEGNKLVIVNPDEGAFDVVESLCPILVLRSSIAGYVSFAEETFVYIQPSEYAETVTWLLEQLFEFYDGKEKEEGSIVPEEEQICAVHSEDGNWYRGKVISFDDETVNVLYIDYGNSETVKFEDLRDLAPQFKEACTLCLKVNIGAEATPYTDKDVTASIFFGEEGWEGTVYILEEAAETSVPITSEDTGLASSSYENTQTIQVENDEQMKAYTEAETDPLMEQILAEAALEKSALCQKGTMVFMSHIDSPSEFYLQIMESLNAIEELQITLQEKVAELPILETPSAGMLCAAPYSVDQEWYRAEILDADDDITTVRFVDFGNTDVIDNKTTQIRTLSPELLTLAVYATKCSLMVKPIEEEWSPLAMELFEALTSQNLVADFLHQDGKLNYVELYVNDSKISDILVEEDVADVYETEEEDTTKGKLTGFVSHLNSPSEFWIQLENCIDDLEWIAEQLSTAENFPELEELTPGTLCAALFPDDQMWYRARILSNTVAGIELLFIDYGNSCTGSSLRQLPEDLVIFQPLAMKCSLQKPTDVAAWSESASTKFSELSADGQTIFTIKKLSTGETSVVQLVLNGEDITNLLESNPTEEAAMRLSTEKTDAVPFTDENDTAPSGEENDTATSAEENDTAASAEENDTAASAEENDTAASVGKSDTAASAEESNRATSVEKNNTAALTEDKVPQSTEVNVAQSVEEGYVTDVKSLENLKVEVAGKPKSDNCKLETVADKQWEESAEEKFKEINQEGTTLYQIEFLDNNSVRLYLDGKDIRPLLTPYFSSDEIQTKEENYNFLQSLTEMSGKISRTGEIFVVNISKTETKDTEVALIESCDDNSFDIQQPEQEVKITTRKYSKAKLKIDESQTDTHTFSSSKMTHNEPADQHQPETIEKPSRSINTLIECSKENKNQLVDGDISIPKTISLEQNNDMTLESSEIIDSKTNDDTSNDVPVRTDSKIPQKKTDALASSELIDSKTNPDNTPSDVLPIPDTDSSEKETNNTSETKIVETMGHLKESEPLPNIESRTKTERLLVEPKDQQKLVARACQTLSSTTPIKSLNVDNNQLADGVISAEHLKSDIQPLTNIVPPISKTVLSEKENDITLETSKINQHDSFTDAASKTDIKSPQKETDKALETAKIIDSKINEDSTSTEVHSVSEKESDRALETSKIVDSKTNDDNVSHGNSSKSVPQAASGISGQTTERNCVSPLHSNKTSPLASRETSRPSSRSSRRFSYDEKILPGYLSRPESPFKDDLKEENPHAEIATLLEKVIDKVTETKVDDITEVRSRPHSRLSHDERIVPGVVSRAASPVEEDKV